MIFLVFFCFFLLYLVLGIEVNLFLSCFWILFVFLKLDVLILFWLLLYWIIFWIRLVFVFLIFINLVWILIDFGGNCGSVFKVFVVCVLLIIDIFLILRFFDVLLNLYLWIKIVMLLLYV